MRNVPRALSVSVWRSAISRDTCGQACSGSLPVKVDICDEEGNVYDGHDIADCDTFAGDSISHRVTWNRSSQIEPRGTVVLRFHMQYADLYSCQFVD